MSASSAAVVKLWGRLVLHNKLMSEQQWNDCYAAFQKANGAKKIEAIILEQKALPEKHVEALRQRVAQIIEEASKQKPKADAGAPAKPAPQPAAEAPRADKPTPPPPPKPEKPAAAPAGAAVEEDDGVIPLAGEVGEPTDANEIEWSADEEQAPAEPEQASDDPGLAPIDLIGDDEEWDPSTSKIIKDDREVVAAAVAAAREPQQPAAAAAPSKPKPAPKAQWGEQEQADDDQERQECDVAPNDHDPTAMKILQQAVKLGASDVHLTAGTPPFCRLHGQLTFFKLDPLTPEQSKRMALGFMNDDQQQQFLRNHDIDFSLDFGDMGRFRVNALEQFRGTSIIFRYVPQEVPTLEQLGIPEELGRLTEWTQGLVLVTGPAGAGKTTTASALVNLVNENRYDHVITVEDPVEFVHVSKNCNVTQRQVPTDTASFAAALKGALREDPDVIMIGEMRDLETVSLALRAAETGHLVIGTLQTKSAARTIDRVIDVFPADQQAQIRTMLAESLRGIISQQLVPRADGKGRAISLEVLYVNRAVSNVIRDGKTFQLPSIMQTGKKIGQRTMDDSLQELINKGTVTLEDARKVSEQPKRLTAKGGAPAPAS